QHHDEGGVEQQLGLFQPGYQRKDRQHHRNRAPQPHPADEQALHGGEPEGGQAHQNRHRSCHQHEKDSHGQRRQGYIQHGRRADQQTEHQEQADLAQPGHAVLHVQDVLQAAQALVAQHQAGYEDRQKAAAAEDVGQSEYQHCAAGDQQRIQAALQGHAVDQPDDGQTAAQTTQAADAELLNQKTEKRPAEGGLAAGKHLHQGNGQEDCHGVVGGRLHLQGGTDPALEIQPFALQQGKHRSSVGGTDNGPQKQTLQPVQIQQPGREQTGEQGADEHAETGQGQRRPECHLEVLGPGAHAPVQQDDRQRQTAEDIDCIDVIEGNPARTFLTGEHAHYQKQQEQRDAQPGRHGTGQNADGQQSGANYEKSVHYIHGG